METTTPGAPSQELVEEFVLAAHANPAKVRALHTAHPELLTVPWAKFDETALQAASHMGRREVAEYLLAAGAPLDICAAAMLGWTDRVASFLATDAGLAQARGAHGIPVLYHAALSGDPAIGDLLVAHGGGEGRAAALHGAILFGHTAMVAWLLEAGPLDVQIRNFDGKTPLQAAQERDQTEIADLLRQHGATE